MMYLLALLLPPLALLLSGKIFQAIFNFILIVFALLIFLGTVGFGSPISFPLYIACIIHAVFVVHGSKSDKKIAAAITKANNS